jgi:subtilisin-like proprotein convertase family protein
MKTYKSLAVAAGVLTLAVSAARLYAAVSVASTDVPKPIPDGPNPGVASVLSFVVAGTVTDANVQFNITHTWDADVLVTLTGPGGAPGPITLMQNCGASADNFTNTVIDDAGAAGGCAFGNAPFTGTFQARQGAGALAPTALAAFNGIASAGTWTLITTDDSAVCTGTLNAWSLTLNGAPPLPVELTDFDVK